MDNTITAFGQQLNDVNCNYQQAIANSMNCYEKLYSYIHKENNMSKIVMVKLALFIIA